MCVLQQWDGHIHQRWVNLWMCGSTEVLTSLGRVSTIKKICQERTALWTRFDKFNGRSVVEKIVFHINYFDQANELQLSVIFLPPNLSTQILSVIDNLKSSYEHIFVGGFSQGGCLSLHMLRSEYMARQPEHLRGIFSMGSFLVKNSTVLKQPRVASDDSRSDLPILMMHGAFKFPAHIQFLSSFIWIT